MNLKEKLGAIQSELKAPKDQVNEFSQNKYKYRNLEDTLEAVKPYLKAQNVSLMLCDSIELIGDRFYIKATATLQDNESDDVIRVTAYAREQQTKKGMDESQLTGASSSYARKYAVSGLFLIDNSKDADSMDNSHKEQEPAQEPKMTKGQQAVLAKAGADAVKPLLAEIGKSKTSELTRAEASAIIDKLGRA